MALSQLRNATPVVVSGTAHNTIHHPCISEIVTDFYQELSPQGVDTMCSGTWASTLYSFPHKDAQIRVEDVAKSFGEVQAVRSVSFTALDGQITGLLGPNGAGKSTTIRMMYGLLTPDRGRVDVDGFDPSRQPVEARKCLGALPDAYGLYPRLTARENIAYFGQLQGMNRSLVNRRIDELNELLDMYDILSRRVDGFSKVKG